MSITVNWENPARTAIRFGFEGQWTWLTLRKKMRFAFALMQHVGHSVDMIFDLSSADGLQALSVRNVASLEAYLPAHSGTLVFVSPDEQAITKLEALHWFYRQNGRHVLQVQTIEQAQLLLEHERRMTAAGERTL